MPIEFGPALFSGLTLWECVNVHLLTQLYYPTNSICRVFCREKFYYLIWYSQKPFERGTTGASVCRWAESQSRIFMEYLFQLQCTEVDRWVLISAAHSPCCAGTHNLAKEESCTRLLQMETIYFVQSGKRGLLSRYRKLLGDQDHK